MRKNPPFTRLEILSKSRVWLVTCWPFLLAVLVLLIDTNKTIHKTSLTFSTTHCVSPLQCLVSSSSVGIAATDRNGGSESTTITFTLPTQCILLHYVNLIGRLKFQIPTTDASFREKSIALTYQVSLNLYALDALGQRTQSLIQNVHMNKEMDVAVIDEESTSTIPTVTHSQFEYDYELGSASMERPWLLPKSRNIQGEIEITVVTHPFEATAGATAGEEPHKPSLEEKNLYNLLVQDFSHQILSGSLIELEYQRELFSLIRALLQLVASAFTLLYLLDYIRLLKEYHRVLYNHSVLPTLVLTAPADASSSTIRSINIEEDSGKVVEEEAIDTCIHPDEARSPASHYQYESLHKEGAEREGGRRAYSPFFFHQSSIGSDGSGTPKEESCDFASSLQKNIATSPAGRFTFLSFLLAEQVG